MSDASEQAALAQLAALLDLSHLAAPDAMAGVVADAASLAGWVATVYLIDYDQCFLVPLTGVEDSEGSPQDVDVSLAGRAFRSVEPVPFAGDRAGLWVPLLDGVERLGVIELRLPAGTDLDDSGLRDRVRWFSHLVGHLIAAKSPYGDTFHTVRSGAARTVASELVWSLLPPLTVACDRVVISGLLEPSARVAGDVFDDAVQDATAHVAIFDATGHDLHSSVIGGLTLAAYRNGRRQTSDLNAIATQVDNTEARHMTAD